MSGCYWLLATVCMHTHNTCTYTCIYIHEHVIHISEFLPLAEQQRISAEAVTETVSFEEGVLSLTFSFQWATNCIPVFSIEIVEVSSGSIVTSHDTLIPTVLGSGGGRTLTLSISGADLVDNTHYTARLISVSAQREVEAQGTVPLSKWWDCSAMLCAGAVLVAF